MKSRQTTSFFFYRKKIFYFMSREIQEAVFLKNLLDISQEEEILLSVRKLFKTMKHTHTRTYIYIYIY